MRGTVGEPQLRGPHPAGSAGELPRVPAAGRGVRARGADRSRRSVGGPGDGQRREARLPPRHLAVRQGSGRRGPLVHQVGDVPQAVRRGLYRGRALARASGSRGRSVRLGARFDLHPPGAVLRRHAANAGPGHGHPGGAGAVLLGRQHHHGPHLARGLHPEDQSCRPVPDRPRGEARGLQLLRRAPRQPRGDGARHRGRKGRSRCTSPTASR